MRKFYEEVFLELGIMSPPTGGTCNKHSTKDRATLYSRKLCPPSIRKEVDLCIAGLGVSLERKRSIEFTTAIFTSEIGLTMAKTDSVQTDYMVYINVFLSDLWVGICTLVVALMAGFLGVHMLLGEKLHLEVTERKHMKRE